MVGEGARSSQGGDRDRENSSTWELVSSCVEVVDMRGMEQESKKKSERERKTKLYVKKSDQDDLVLHKPNNAMVLFLIFVSIYISCWTH